MAVRALHGLAFRGANRDRPKDCMGLRALHGVAFGGAGRVGRFSVPKRADIWPLTPGLSAPAAGFGFSIVQNPP